MHPDPHWDARGVTRQIVHAQEGLWNLVSTPYSPWDTSSCHAQNRTWIGVGVGFGSHHLHPIRGVTCKNIPGWEGL